MLSPVRPPIYPKTRPANGEATLVTGEEEEKEEDDDERNRIGHHKPKDRFRPMFNW